MTVDTHAAPPAVALSHDAALTYPGTLLAPDGTLVAPYDWSTAARVPSATCRPRPRVACCTPRTGRSGSTTTAHGTYT